MSCSVRGARSVTARGSPSRPQESPSSGVMPGSPGTAQGAPGAGDSAMSWSWDRLLGVGWGEEGAIDEWQSKLHVVAEWSCDRLLLGVY